MSVPTPSSIPLLRRLPAILLGGVLIALGAVVMAQLDPPPQSFTQLLALASEGLGFIWIGFGLCQRTGHYWDLFRLINANAIILVGLFAAIETGGRVSGIDFGQLGGQSTEKQREAYPVCSREPDVPIPEVFFRHPGPVTWTGQPLRTLEVLRKGTDNAYVNERPITVTYDHDGFRNPEILKDWDIVIVGDSYTELGYLPIEQVTSFIVAQRSGLRVKNLGVCDTGLLSQVRYLTTYGRAASTNTAVFVMFEGNDVQDTTREFEALQQFKKTGEREFKDLGPQTSFIAALGKAISSYRNRPTEQSFQNAWFTPPGGQSLPITISVELPIDPLRAEPMQTLAMREALRSVAEEARRLHLTPMLVYVPVNNRVYHDMLKFSDSLPEEVKGWQPNALPEFIANACREQGITFVDSTPALRGVAEEGTFVHNTILDCHLNAEGTRILGEVIADALKSTVKPAQLASQNERLHGAP